MLEPSQSDQNVRTIKRRPSVGTVWTIGGVAPNGSAIDDGHGRLVRTGTTAQIFRTSFSDAKPKKQEDLAEHQARLASALNLDRVGRTLDIQGKASQSWRTNGRFGRSFSSLPTRAGPGRSFWDGIELVNDGGLKSEYPLGTWQKSINKIEYTDKGLKTRELPAAPFK